MYTLCVYIYIYRYIYIYIHIAIIGSLPEDISCPTAGHCLMEEPQVGLLLRRPRRRYPYIIPNSSLW